jgi:hypothetical protein
MLTLLLKILKLDFMSDESQMSLILKHPSGDRFTKFARVYLEGEALYTTEALVPELFPESRITKVYHVPPNFNLEQLKSYQGVQIWELKGNGDLTRIN